MNGKATQEVDKSELQKEVDKKDDTKASDKYKNADQDKKAAYDKALEDAKKVLENKDATQEEVNKAKEDLAKAEEALNGKATQEVDADKVDPAVPGKTKVEDSSNLTKDEKDKVKEAIEKANKDKFPQGTKVEIGNDGSATITYPDESKDTIKGSDLVEKIADAPTRPSKPSKQDKPSKNLPKAGIESEAMMMAAAALSTLGGLYVSRKKKEDER